MALLAECPVCRQPLRWTYLVRPMWSQWSCERCGSLLGIDRKRRVLAILLIAVLAPVAAVYLPRAGWSNFTILPATLMVWLPFFLLLDRATVLERHGFRCQQCGYDLRGQVVPRCPECGREFDAAERSVLETGVFPDAPAGRRSRAWLGIALLVFAVLLTSLAVGITRYKVVKARAARRQAIAARQAAQAANSSSASQPTGVVGRTRRATEDGSGTAPGAP
ncbi:MAG: hypothetical protein ACE5I3_01520 [Phycisphaerae bacterium]